MIVVDAHMHIWNKLHGRIGKSTPLVGLGNGQIRIGDGKPLLGMPAYMGDCAARAEYVVGEFDAAGVDVGVVVQENMDGEQNEYCVEMIRKFPGRFFCHGLPDYFSPQTFAKQCDALFSTGFKGIKVPGGHMAMESVAIDDKAFMPVWERMASEGHVVAVDFSEGEGQVAVMENILKQFPKLKAAIGHFGMVNRKGWPGQLKLCRHENVYMESGGIIWLYRHEGYPFPGAIDAIVRAKNEVSIDKLMWGSDWPRTMVDFTYRQSIEFVRQSKALTDVEKGKFLGENAARLYGLKAPSKQREPIGMITDG